MGKHKISVIVPVYKSENYIRQCLDSILCQTYSQLEIIVVDDGTPDNSGVICDEYAEKDARVRVIHQENHGVAAARNVGIAAATGEYIAFVDSDDYIAENMYESLLEKAQEHQAEVIYCEAKLVFPDGTLQPDEITQLTEDCELTHASWTPNLLKEMAGAVTHAMYAARLISDYRIRFSEGLTFSEDRVFNIYAMGYAKKVYFCKKEFYFLHVNESSITHSYHRNHFELAKRAHRETQRAMMTVWGNDTAYQKAYLEQFIDAYMIGIKKMIACDGKNGVRRCIGNIKNACEDAEFRAALQEYDCHSTFTELALRKKYAAIYCFFSSRWFRFVYPRLTRMRELGLSGTVHKLLTRRARV